jgi:hypothetical protein
MSGPAGEYEPAPPADQRQDKVFLSKSTPAWLLGVSTVGVLSYAMFSMWDDEEIRLHVLHTLVKLLQAVARVIGMWAIEFERAYNEAVDVLH